MYTSLRKLGRKDGWMGILWINEVAKSEGSGRQEGTYDHYLIQLLLY